MFYFSVLFVVSVDRYTFRLLGRLASRIADNVHVLLSCLVCRRRPPPMTVCCQAGQRTDIAEEVPTALFVIVEILHEQDIVRPGEVPRQCIGCE